LPVIKRNALVPYTAQQMFELINNIGQYPAFLPWCKAVKMLRQEDNTVEASVCVAKGPWQKTFTTRNTLQPHSCIQMKLLNGPFHYLEGQWHIEQSDVDSTAINFELSFELNNPLLSFTIGPLIHNVANTLIKAFIDRAHQVYAKEHTVY
jgi:ribosome-associated toxin RatA of RatAB toxin-antitoxin module